MKKRIRTLEEVAGAEIMLEKIKEIAYESKNLDEFKFELMLMNSTLRNTKEIITANNIAKLKEKVSKNN